MSARRDAFASYHPALVFGFFVAAIVLCVIVNSLLFSLAALACAAAYYLCVRGLGGLKVICGLIPVCCVIALANPLFNTLGDTALFTWLDDRPYTLEALAYGASTACMFASALVWFFSFNKAMTTEKLTFLFGHLAPALTLVFTMVMRLVPSYQRKAGQIARARACIGRFAGQGGTWRRRAKDGLDVLSTLVTWALEESVVTADSMRSRGYGQCRRTSYAAYPFTLRDAALLLAMVLLLSIAIACIAGGAGRMEYFPVIAFSFAAPQDALALFCLCAFMLMPSIVNVEEAISWRISLSRI